MYFIQRGEVVIVRLADGEKLRLWLEHDLRERFGSRILPIEGTRNGLLPILDAGLSAQLGKRQ